MRRHNKPFDPSITLSIVTPVYNTKADFLQECILSVRYQTCPYWQLILIDDGSTAKDTLSVLNSRLCDDPRIHVILNDSKNHGISAASNLGIAESSGNYIGFLDHDDRLAVDAVQWVYDALRDNSSIDILYSDRDMISPNDKRHMYLMKPDWSPETLLSGNYLFHFVCYRKRLINQVGGLRAEYDGSQDYDLILRCGVERPIVKHIPRVLYHWRQSEVSVSLDEDAKGYAFDAGIRALQDTLERRQIQAKVWENRSLWRGNYQLEFDPSTVSTVKEISIDDSPQIVDSVPGKQFLFFRNAAYKNEHQHSIRELVSWLTVEGVGIVTGKCISANKKNIYAGAVLKSNGAVLFPYRGENIAEPGYMALTQIVHNISVPDYNCFMVRPELWEELQGFDSRYESFAYKVYDFSLRAAVRGWRAVFNPRALFVCENIQDIHTEEANDQERFRKKWSDWLQKGDPYYSPNLSQESNCYQLRDPNG
jgi:glycosyltransferase involved in cell wall biosynthesis